MTWAILLDLEETHRNAIIELLTGSERALVVVGGALLDESVRRTLEERLINKPDVVKHLLDPDRPLGAFKPKVDLLYLLGGVDEPTRMAMNGIAAIRNFFAHNLSANFKSTDRDFLKGMRRLTLNDGLTRYPHHLAGGDSDVEVEPTPTDQARFVVNLKLCLIALMRDRMRHYDFSNTPLIAKDLLEKFLHLMRRDEGIS